MSTIMETSSTTHGGLMVAKIHQLSGRIMTRLMKKSGIKEINPAQGRILFALSGNDGVSLRELAERTSLGKSTLTLMLDRMEKAGLVTRALDMEDKRRIIIKLTGKDKKIIEKFSNVLTEMEDILYAGFSDSEKEEVDAYLTRIFENVASWQEEN